MAGGRHLEIDISPYLSEKSSDFHDVIKQEVKVIWQKAPHGGPIPRLGVTPGGEICTVEFLG